MINNNNNNDKEERILHEIDREKILFVKWFDPFFRYDGQWDRSIGMIFIVDYIHRYEMEGGLGYTEACLRSNKIWIENSPKWG